MKQPLAYVHPEAKIAPNVVIEPFVTIDKNVEIGEGTRIGSNVTILEGARIGKNCQIFNGIPGQSRLFCCWHDLLLLCRKIFRSFTSSAQYNTFILH